MPHVVLDTSSPLYELLEGVEPFVKRNGDTVWRLRNVYLDTGDRRGLAECLVVVRGRQNRFFLQLTQRDRDGSVVVRLHPVPQVDAQPSVKRMVALVAEAVERAHPDAEIAHTTIREFLSDEYRYAPDPEWVGWDPRLIEHDLSRPMDWSTVFGGEGPVEIEIGSGKGTFLVEAASARPETRFLSIEWAHEYAEYIRDRLRRRDLRNVRVVQAEAGRFIADHVPPGSVRVVHIYFPDPWPKKRHHKRRLITPEFVAAVAGSLEAGGEIRFVTDHEAYFEEATAVIEAEPRLDPSPVPSGVENLTNYERKYREEGRSIYRAFFRRTEATR